MGRYTWDGDMCGNTHEHLQCPYSPEFSETAESPLGLSVLPRIQCDISTLKSCTYLEENLPVADLKDNVWSLQNLHFYFVHEQYPVLSDNITQLNVT